MKHKETIHTYFNSLPQYFVKMLMKKKHRESEVVKKLPCIK
ncbi:hypothetical protein CU025_2286 [Enterococcus faecium]|nr:hypothetical protein [Enterococcus faecium]MBK4767721.1 hypothetical protein [Enterococcus faecium]MBK4808546.1 hypothetical protein [Enterococcus faecium]MBK4812418.1 hypothetical protein [Enterococcus faecium]MBK4822665.1 hypothetical protein [Enterococcus faecium]